MSSQRISIRVTLEPDGKTPKRELMVGGIKIADVSYVEVLEAAMQFVSSLRYEVKR